MNTEGAPLVGAYWGGRYYVDPLALRIECGENPSRETAVAALLAASRLVSSGVIGGLLVFVGASFIVMASLLTGFATPFGFSIFRTIMWLFTMIGLLTVAFGVATIARARRRANALRGLAAMVQSGLVKPEEVCGLTIGAAIELYRMRAGTVSGALPPGAPSL